MVFEYWHLAVVAAVIAVIVWLARTFRRGTLVGGAVAMLLISAWLLHTLVLEEQPYLEFDRDAVIDTSAMIGTPALLGIALAVLAIRRFRSPRA